MPWLLAYDIADHKRLLSVHRRMKRHAMPLEYSVFWLEGSDHDRHACLGDVLPLLNRDEDDLRFYAMPSRGLRMRMGVAALPEGIVWTALPGGRWREGLAGLSADESWVEAASA